ncbi:hypothetical protein [Miniphocaeibacter halophilus]|uniref:AAA family ATPase n=1 Tax=Miniphocaeibacter halophilus TaxID=2931922 RepID=A0AC61MRX7_9FIRM|nr:hypothetical protein [Miniphocaeibacter halophilus]QQK07619.1 AAA family ATPase [Miniphocaeibacter halophilus]
MTYLRRMEIINFQSHEYTDLYFDNKVNVIIGPSDSGKTAVIRALKWVLFNEPSGIDFIRKNSKEAKIILYFDNEIIITRGRSKSKNYYEITYPAGEVERFEGFGTKVPKEVIDVTNISKVQLDGNNLIALNISDQLESPFLLTESPSIKAVAIGKLAGIEKVDLALNKLSKDINEINAEKKSLEKEKDIQLENLKNYDFLDSELEEIKYISNIISEIDKKKILLEKYKRINSSYLNIQNQINDYNIYINKFANLLNYENIVEKSSSILTKRNNLRNINLKLLSVNNEINKYNSILSKTKNLNNVIVKYEDIVEKSNKYSKLQSIHNKLVPLNYNIERFLSLIKSNKVNNLSIQLKKLDSLEKKYIKLFNLNKNLIEINSRIKNGNIYIKQFKNIDDLSLKYNKSTSLEIIYEKLNKYKENLEEINKKILYLEDTIKTESMVNNKILEKYIDLLKESSICPYCFNDLDENHLNKIISEYEV